MHLKYPGTSLQWAIICGEPIFVIQREKKEKWRFRTWEQTKVDANLKIIYASEPCSIYWSLTFYAVLVVCCIFSIYILLASARKTIVTHFNRARRTLGNYLRRYCSRRLNLSHRWALFSVYFFVWLLVFVLLMEYMGWSKWNICVPPNVVSYSPNAGSNKYREGGNRFRCKKGITKNQKCR